MEAKAIQLSAWVCGNGIRKTPEQIRDENALSETKNVQLNAI